MAAVIDKALRYEPFDGRVSVYLFGTPLDWNIAGEDQKLVHQRLGELAGDLGLVKLLAPKASSFNAQVCAPEELTEEIRLPGEVRASLWRGVLADGCEIPRGEAFWMSSADCISVIAHDPKDGKTIAAHGGRDCLMDRGRINGDKSPREFESVVHSIAAQFSKSNV